MSPTHWLGALVLGAVAGVFCAATVSGAGGSGGIAVWPVLRGISSFGVGTGSASIAMSSPQANDLILAWITIAGDQTATVTLPSGEGWTTETSVADAGGSDIVLTLAWKYWGHGSVDSSSPVFTSSNGATTVGVVLETWQSVRQASPINVSATAHGAGGTTVNPPDAYNSATERVSVSCCVAGLSSAGNISSINGSLYVQTAAGSSYATTSGPDQALGFSRNENVTVMGSVSASGVTATFTVANTAWAGITVVIRGP